MAYRSYEVGTYGGDVQFVHVMPRSGFDFTEAL